MVEREPPDQEPRAEAPAAPEPPAKGRQSFAKLRRELSDEELASPAVQRMLIDEIDRLERDVAQLREIRDQYHEADRRCAVLEEKNNIANAHEVLYGVCLTMGAAALGFAPSLWEHQPAGILSIAFGLVLISGGVASKVIQTSKVAQR